MKRIRLAVFVVLAVGASLWFGVQRYLLRQAEAQTRPGVTKDSDVHFTTSEEPARRSVPSSHKTAAAVAAPAASGPRRASDAPRPLTIPTDRNVFEQSAASELDPFSDSPPARSPAASPLQQQFLDLMRTRSNRMSDAELQEAVRELTASIDRQNTAAEAALQQAAFKLFEVAAQFRGTPAGTNAGKALNVLGLSATRDGKLIRLKDGTVVEMPKDNRDSRDLPDETSLRKSGAIDDLRPDLPNPIAPPKSP